MARNEVQGQVVNWLLEVKGLQILVMGKLSGKTSHYLFQIGYFCLVSDYDGLSGNSCLISICNKL